MIFDPPRDLHKELYERLAAEHKADETDRQSDEEAGEAWSSTKKSQIKLPKTTKPFM